MKLFDNDLNWYKGNLHTHTTVSDGRRTPEEAIEIYRAKGYDFLALTDHKKMSWSRMDGGMLLTGGVELDYTLDDQVIHIVGIGLESEPQLDPPMRGACAQDGIDAINAAGGIAILAHPAWSLNTLAGTFGLKGIAAMEIYNSVSGAPWNAARADSSCFADITYTHGKYTPVVASDDAHFYTGEHTLSYTWVNAPELTPDAIKTAIRAGHMYASQGPRFHQVTIEGNRLTIDCTPVSRAIVFSNAFYVPNRSFVGEGMTHIEYQINPSERYLRIQLDDAEGKSAWTGAIPLK